MASSKSSLKNSDKHNLPSTSKSNVSTGLITQNVGKAVFEPHLSASEPGPPHDNDSDFDSEPASDDWIGEDERASDSIAPSVMSEPNTQRHRMLMQQPPRGRMTSYNVSSDEIASFEMPVFAAESQKAHFYARFFGPRYENLKHIADKNNIVCNYQPGSEVLSLMKHADAAHQNLGRRKECQKGSFRLQMFC